LGPTNGDRRNLDRLHFLAYSLREVGIPSRILDDDQKNLRLMVRPEDEARAREIARQILEAAGPERSIPRPEEEIWYDQPVRSWLFAWLPGAVYSAIMFFVYAMQAEPGEFLASRSPLDPFFSLIKFVNEIAGLWMLYQAVRYEIRPLRFVLLSIIPFSFVWYYYERYSRRQFRQRLPIVIREQIATRPYRLT